MDVSVEAGLVEAASGFETLPGAGFAKLLQAIAVKNSPQTNNTPAMIVVRTCPIAPPRSESTCLSCSINEAPNQFAMLMRGRCPSASVKDGGLAIVQGPKNQTFPMKHYDRDTFTYETEGENAVG
ncbi:MAG: hypothetical protein ACXWNQ_02730, partial [Anaerolineales bacterium]